MIQDSFPIIHIIGLPGAGKSTLAKKLATEFGIPILRIGEYRSRFPMSAIGEADAWVALYRGLSDLEWGNCILETTGLNGREHFLRTAFPFSRIVTIKLEAQRKVLYARLSGKRKDEQGGDWLFREDYGDKREFVRKLFGKFKEIPAHIRIDTSKLTLQDVYKIALEELHPWLPEKVSLREAGDTERVVSSGLG